MVLVFIITFISITILAVLLSTISIRIEKLEISNCNSINKLTYNFEIYFEILTLNKFKIFSLKINKDKIKQLNSKVKFKNKMQNMNFKKIKQDFPKIKLREILKKLNINVQKFNLKFELGTEDVIITSALIAIISSALGIFLAKVIKSFNKEKYSYEIKPIYHNKNLINLYLNCIIKVKVVHIISIIYLLLRKRRVESNERTSNRRAYDYSYE